MGRRGQWTDMNESLPVNDYRTPSLHRHSVWTGYWIAATVLTLGFPGLIFFAGCDTSSKSGSDAVASGDPLPQSLTEDDSSRQRAADRSPTPSKGSSESTSIPTPPDTDSNPDPPVENQVEANTDDARLNPPQTVPEQAERKYSEAALHKNNTLLVLAYQSDIRADFHVNTVRPYISEEQARRAKRLALSYDWRYTELRRERAAILERATDETRDQVEADLLAVRKKVVDLNAEIRGRINREILTPEQFQQVRERFQSRN